MSRRWTDRVRALTRAIGRRVRVYFGTQGIAVDLLGGRAGLQHAATRPVEGTGRADASAALDALAEALQGMQAEAGSLRGLRCEVVLADAWIVYDVVPLDLARVAPAAAQRAICAALADVAGLPRHELAVCWQAQNDGTSAFAMAMPRALLAQLHALLDAHGLRVVSMVGEFVAVFNAQRKTLTGERAVLAVGREAGAQIAVLVDRTIAATRFELGRSEAADLAQAAAGVMRARGEDTTAPVDYVLDADADSGRSDGRWTRVATPAWADAAARAAAAHAAATAAE